MLTRILRTFLAPYRRPLAAVLILSLVGTMASLYLPSLNAAIIDEGIAKGDTGFIWRTAGMMISVSLIQIVCSIAGVYLGAKVAMSFGRDVRGAIFSRVLAFSSRELNRFGAPSLITRNTNDVQQVQMLVMLSATMFIAAPITMIGGVLMALREDVGLSWLVVVAVPLLAISVGLAVGRLMASIFPIVMFIMNASSVAVLWFGARRVDSGAMQIGSLTAFLTYLVQILMSVMMATFLLMLAPRAAVCAERIGEVLEPESTVVLPENPVTALDESSVVRFRDAEFTYPGADAPVLSDITFTAEPGQTTAIIGSTGAGKSTLISLIPRLFDVTGGSVQVDGVEVRNMDADLLWSRIGLVPQKAFLFSGTVASNLRYGNPDATDEELWHAIRVAQAEDFVRAMPGQLEASITQGGTNVSGGQRQRLSIARALVKQPEIYVFDDSFSALDVTTDARLRAALEAETRDRCVIIVGQRAATIADADQIVVLEHGEVVGTGTHEELLETCPTYAEIVDSQLSATEAAA